MTSPIVIETTSRPEPVVPDPFIADVAAPVAALPPPEPRRRRIWD